MKIFVKAKANSKTESVEKVDETHFSVSVKEPPIKGQANAAIAKALAQHFDVPLSQISLVSGFSVKTKTFEIT